MWYGGEFLKLFDDIECVFVLFDLILGDLFLYEYWDGFVIFEGVFCVGGCL